MAAEALGVSFAVAAKGAERRAAPGAGAPVAESPPPGTRFGRSRSGIDGPGAAPPGAPRGVFSTSGRACVAPDHRLRGPGRVQRAPRARVVVPVGRSPEAPGSRLTRPNPRAPHPAPSADVTGRRPSVNRTRSMYIILGSLSILLGKNSSMTSLGFREIPGTTAENQPPVRYCFASTLPSSTAG